jgi:hypothetical protein
MSTVADRPRPADPDSLRGTFRRFASGGPAYEVVAVHPERATGTILVHESGEEFEYPLAEIAADDEERGARDHLLHGLI